MADEERRSAHPVFQEGKMVIDRFRIVKHIGQGGYGDIYAAVDTRDDKQVAVKIEYLDADKQALIDEIRIMLNLKGTYFFPTLVYDGVSEDFRFLVMDLFGPSLSGMRRSLRGHRYTMYTVLKLSLAMLKCIEEFHKRGYLHRDIKPGNFLIRPNRHHPVCLIDFGLSQTYLNPTTHEHVQWQRDVGFTGTCRYASLNAHQEKQLSRRDDLISWFYSVLELVDGKVPWPGSRDKEETIRMKKKMSVTELCGSLPWQWRRIWKILNHIRFKEEPNYRLIRWLIKRSIKGLGLENPKFDWESLDADVIQEISSISLTMTDGTSGTTEAESEAQDEQGAQGGCSTCNVA